MDEINDFFGIFMFGRVWNRSDGINDFFGFFMFF